MWWALYHRCGVTLELVCTEIRPTPDLDQDGDVDLADISAALLAMSGPGTGGGTRGTE